MSGRRPIIDMNAARYAGAVGCWLAVRLLLLLVLLCWPAVALPSGAPLAACSRMKPRHGSHQSQTVAPPYRLTSEMRADGGWLVHLRAVEVFRGVLLQARAATNRGGPPIGHFLPAPEMILLDCDGNNQSALTHHDTVEKHALDVVWQPSKSGQSGDAGEVVFIATVLQQYHTWWEGITSDVLAISADKPISQARLQLPSRVADTYDGCFIDYGCFGTPAKCESTKTCDVLFTYVASGDGIRMGLLSQQQQRFAAVGISQDAKMGSDGVIFCSNPDDALPVIYYGYNDDKSSSYKTKPSPSGVSGLSKWEEDGHFMCSFTQSVNLIIPGIKSFDLTKEHHLLVATGPIDESSKPSYHHDKKIASAQPVDLTDSSSFASAGVPWLIKAHGICMIIAWIGTAGVGILSAQHLRLTWVGKQILGKDVWFTLHRSLMVITALSTWLGFTFIVIYEEKLEFDRAHNIVGFCVFLLTVTQVLGGMARPSPTAPLRPFFAWGHRIAGVSAYILALVGLFLSQQLPEPGLPRYWLWLLTAAVALDAVISLVFMGITHCVVNTRVQSTSGTPEKQEAPGSSHRKVLLGIYSFFSVAFVIAMITILILADGTQ